MDELLLIIARAHQHHLREQAERPPGRRLRWRRVRTGQATIVVLPRHAGPATTATSFDDVA
jgi:hypothetical protein